MYRLIAVLSLLIRNFILPNSFEKLSMPLYVSLSGTEVAIPTAILNLFIEPILQPITFTVVGFYYKKGIDNPAKGSFLYLLFYCVHIGMLSVMSYFRFLQLIVVAIIVAYVALHIGVKKIINKALYCR